MDKIREREEKTDFVNFSEKESVYFMDFYPALLCGNDNTGMWRRIQLPMAFHVFQQSIKHSDSVFSSSFRNQ